MNNGQNKAASFPLAIKEAIRAQLLDLHVMLPGKIKAYYPSKGTVDVDLLLKQRRRQPDGTFAAKDYPTLMNIPVMFPRCAGGAITFPLAADDLGAVVFADRDIGDWVQGTAGQSVDPGDGAAHDLNGAAFYPGLYPATNPMVPPASTAAVVVSAGEGKQLHLGAQDPPDAVALAQIVLDRLNAIAQKFDTHTHVVSGTCTAPGGTVAGSTTSTSPHIGTLQSVASEKVKCA